MTPEVLAPRLAILIKTPFSGYDAEHLVRVFYPAAKLRAGQCTRGLLVYARVGARRLAVGLRLGGAVLVQTAPLPKTGGEKAKKQTLCRYLYGLLCRHTGLAPPWGLLTGVRPVNHLRKRVAQLGNKAAERYFLESCRVSPEKLALAKGILALQAPVLARFATPRHYSLYVSIPFCPSRCAYCSFVSRSTQREGHLIEPYLARLAEELALTAQLARECGLRLATAYIGGGTPTALSAPQLKNLLQIVQRHFAPEHCAEYTVEAGRPDCTSFEKLKLLKDYGVHRISINPQTFRNDVLAGIGRRHTAQDILRCHEDARRVGHDCVNMDLIAGLPGDDAAGFAKTMGTLLALAPQNITIHGLTLKRASNMVIEGGQAHSAPAQMLAEAYPRLAAAGYAPYYLYRQKSSVDNLENTGWCQPGTQGLYNICIMEEAHSILAAGAGAATKLVAGGNIKRRYNHKLPLEYIENFAEIVQRKKGVKSFYASHLDTETPG